MWMGARSTAKLMLWKNIHSPVSQRKRSGVPGPSKFLSISWADAGCQTPYEVIDLSSIRNIGVCLQETTVSFRPHVRITHHTGSWTEHMCISSRITDPYEHPPNEVRNGFKTHFFRSRTATYSIYFFYLLSLPIWFVPEQPSAPLCPMATSQHWGNHRIWISCWIFFWIEVGVFNSRGIVKRPIFMKGKSGGDGLWGRDDVGLHDSNWDVTWVIENIGKCRFFLRTRSRFDILREFIVESGVGSGKVS